MRPMRSMRVRDGEEVPDSASELLGHVIRLQAQASREISTQDSGVSGASGDSGDSGDSGCYGWHSDCRSTLSSVPSSPGLPHSDIGPPLPVGPLQLRTPSETIEVNRQLSTGDVYVEVLRRGSFHTSIPSILPTAPGVPDPALEISLTLDDALQGAPTQEEYTEHVMDVGELAAALGTRLDMDNPMDSAGLQKEEVMAARETHGPNVLTPPVRLPLWALFLLQFLNLFMLLLLTASLLAFIAYVIDPSDLSNLYLGVLLLIVVVVTCYETFAQEAKSEELMEGFRKLVPERAYVHRGGLLIQVGSEELVRGDILQLKTGDKVPVDARIVFHRGLKLDQSLVTGESEAVEGSVEARSENPLEAGNLVFRGSLVVDGSCLAITIRTGDGTLMGKMVNMTAEAGGDQKSTLKADIEDFVYKISAFALLQAVVIFAIGLGRGLDPLQIFVQGFIVVVVANIPQGLPTTITASLYIVAERMAKQRVFVKKLDVIETLGSVSLIATDKTGTLTLNQMQVSDVWLNGVSLTADDFLGGKADVEEQMYKIVGSQSASSPSVIEQDGSDEEGKYDDGDGDSMGGGWRGRVGEKQVQLFVETLSLNSRVQPDYSEMPLSVPLDTLSAPDPQPQPTGSSPVEPGDKGTGEDGSSPCPKLLGDATEVGIYAFARRAIARLHASTPLADLETFRSTHPKQFEIQFNSQNKWQFSIHTRTDGRSGDFGLIKGAPDIIAKAATAYMSPDGPVPMDQAFRDRLDMAANRFAAQGKRVLGLAYAPLQASYYQQSKDDDAAFTDAVEDIIRGQIKVFEDWDRASEADCRNGNGNDSAGGKGDDNGGDRGSGHASLGVTRPMRGTQSPHKKNKVMAEFCFLGLIMLRDPPRPRARRAVQECQEAGIQVVMITGDHPITAAAIAVQVGVIPHMPRAPCTLESLADLARQRRSSTAAGGDIEQGQQTSQQQQPSTFNDEPLVVPGYILQDMTHLHWSVVTASRQVVFARTTPEDKLLVVKMFAGDVSGKKRVIGMTGDGVNDSPALKEAAVGIAMGTGSDVSKEAADMVILDDNFESIVIGIREGRLLFTNLKKSIAYTLAHLMPELLPVVLWAIVGVPLAISGILTLCIDLLTEVLPATSLAYEPAKSDLMSVPPRDLSSDKLVDARLLFYSYLEAGTLITGVCLFTMLFTYDSYGVSAYNVFANDNQHFPSTDGSSVAGLSPDEQKEVLASVQATWFLTLVIAQACHSFTCRTRVVSIFTHGLFSNPYLVGGSAAAVAIACFIIYTPGLQDVVATGEIDSLLMLYAALLATSALWAFTEASKAASRTWGRDNNPCAW